MESSQQHEEPRRLSALYQYHNAPEVAPAHGLEYDDTIYPSSDKYPVIREQRSYHKGEYDGFQGDNKPPRIIFGMKVRTFLLVALVMILVVVGAAVGGAVGGKSLRSSQSEGMGVVMNSSSTAIPSSIPASTYSAPTPTYTPLSDCSNNTAYTSTFFKGSSGTPPKTAGLNFTRYCGYSDPLALENSQRIAEAFVYSFSDCIEVCAGYNFWNAGSNCTAAVYQPGGRRPGNCWVGNAGSVQIGAISNSAGTDVALLASQ